ncbi:MAG TPA: CxxC-x17-CxxC domain-containing protein [Thermomicrobiales bacterium]|nr:CxxC-x17-CxxC domain-containing protein [Thermomicrobiales bacterium]
MLSAEHSTTGGHRSEQRTCGDCGDTYAYTETEQRFRSEQGMKLPTRCPQCRADRRAARNADLVAGETASRSRARRQRERRPEPQGRGGHRHGGNGFSGERYPAVCADCGQSTMVPFVPRGDRPVYCRSCYSARRGR